MECEFYHNQSYRNCHGKGMGATQQGLRWIVRTVKTEDVILVVKYTLMFRRVDNVDWFNREIIASSLRAIFATGIVTLQHYGGEEFRSLGHP